MYPQTHVYFTHRVCGELSDALVLGSIFPDMAAAFTSNRQESHGKGGELLAGLGNDPSLYDFARGVITHGINPAGLDYYGDEKYLQYERGYCFEKSRPLVAETIRACNLPPRMGWWKSHNIVEMGIELRFSTSDYGSAISAAFRNEDLIEQISRRLAPYYAVKPQQVKQRMHNFSHYIEISSPTARSLAVKFDVQMFYRHRIHIDIERTAALICRAGELVEADLRDFFTFTEAKTRKHLLEAEKTLPKT
ncbi:hypothetical protein [Desulfotomaculum copahuensis]|uniref:Uncharacterized protein n=1 Tax=Desulfotomaculum copahuensis TaxID=1838280 RepID=A0A1B7LDM3_9FIRM|nr:hypothetical protein [Desulfotomaculum copahuensis]OAT81187.1 hypothetical protein A6M21_11675 [Desulfotomaculum copahuensis]